MERVQIHRVSVADQAAGILRQRILTGELRPGTALPEVPFSAALGVSRNTLREAVRILALEGLLKRDIHRGVSVSQLSISDVREIYRLRHMLEIAAVQQAEDPSVESLRQLRGLVGDYEASVRACDWIRAVDIDFQFHTQLIRFHHNRRLESFYQKLIGELRMGMVLVDRVHDDPSGLVPVHLEICELLAAGDLEGCAQVLTRHLNDSEARLREIVGRYVEEREVSAGD